MWPWTGQKSSVWMKFSVPRRVIFEGVLLTKEGTALDPLEKEFKQYARGIGLIQDQNLLLTGYGFISMLNPPY